MRKGVLRSKARLLIYSVFHGWTWGIMASDVNMYANLTDRIPNNPPENIFYGKEESARARTGIMIGDGSVLLRRASS